MLNYIYQYPRLIGDYFGKHGEIFNCWRYRMRCEVIYKIKNEILSERYNKKNLLEIFKFVSEKDLNLLSLCLLSIKNNDKNEKMKSGEDWRSPTRIIYDNTENRNSILKDIIKYEVKIVRNKNIEKRNYIHTLLTILGMKKNYPQDIINDIMSFAFYSFHLKIS